MKKIVICAFLSIFMSNALAKSQFEQLGDGLRYMPIAAFIVSLGMQDYKGALQVALGAGSTQIAIEGIKYSFQAAANRGNKIAFAKRPCCEDYKGMPSGHAGGAFSAAGYVFYRYGWKYALPVITLAVVTDASRVYAKKHSVWQVAAGSAIAWGFAWLFTSDYNEEQRLLITPEISADAQSRAVYGVNVRYVW